jgi:2-oxoglutarate ferredoxin oxidoreductase subunit alpha
LHKDVTPAKKILIKGNEALGEAAILAGCRYYFGYPITPQNEVPAYMSRRLPEVGGVFIQSESEVAAINMVFGAALTGARAMTSSSSPGISLKQEGISYLAACELPAVIANMTRGGPGLGNIASSQGDYFQATKGGGHGDYHSIVLAPASIQELVNLTIRAFDLADKYRTPVMILGDGILGQMMETVDFSLAPKPQHFDKPWALTGAKGRQAQMIRSLYLGDNELEALCWKLKEKYDRIQKEEVLVEELFLEDAEIVIMAFGTCARIAKSSMMDARNMGLKVGMIRPITLYPYPYEAVARAASRVKHFLVFEMNLGQMVEDVKIAVAGQAQVHFYGRPGGGIPTPEELQAEIEKVGELVAGGRERKSSPLEVARR